MKYDDIYKLIDQAKNLPPSPEILPKLLKVLEDDHATYWQIAKLVHLDQALTSQVLTWSNSGYYGYLDRSSDIEEAIGRVGLGEIYKLVGIIMSKRLMNKPCSFYGLDAGQLWENSLAGAFSMEALSHKTGENPNISYTIGLLHGVGKIVIDQVCPDTYPKVFELIQEKGASLLDAEKEVVGWNHAEIGGALLRKWNFQEEICQAVENQYVPKQARESGKNLAHMMNIGHFLISSLGQNFGRNAMAIELDPNSLKLLNITESELQVLLINIQEKIEEVKSQLKVAE